MKEDKNLFDINKIFVQNNESKHTLTDQITRELLMEYGYDENVNLNITTPVSKTKKKTIK